MPSLHLSNYTSRIDHSNPWIKTITWFIRELVGGTFLFSGFTKAIDPWGTLYKIEDYLAVMGLNLWPNLILAGVFLLCAVEFVVGALLCFGSFRRSVSWAALCIILFMLPLTLWIAMFDPVADCGCFGDAFIISNWATFWKNVVLTIGIGWLVLFNKKAGWLITPALQWIELVATSLFILVISLAGYIYQPLLDFRPYKIGSPLIESEDNIEEGSEFKFIYEKDGIKKEFGMNDELPDEEQGWVFIERIPLPEKLTETSKDKAEKSFRLWDKTGEEDVTSEVLSDDEDYIILLMPQLRNVSIASTWKINSLYDWTRNRNIEMLAAVTGTPEEIENWEDLSMPEYPIFTADDTAIKEVARGNPAVVYVSDGIIRWKSTLRALNADDFLSPETSANPMSFARDDHNLLLNTIYLYLAFMAVLIAFSFLPRIRHAFTRGGKAPREESSSLDKPAQ